MSANSVLFIIITKPPIKSPIAYLKSIRLQHALSMLSADYYPINEIAKQCGYGSSDYFIQTFRKAKGYSPQKWKELYFKNMAN